jgi:peptidoglycan/xylan/chitin deacetylase (PgdA/CDA1 family)
MTIGTLARKASKAAVSPAGLFTRRRAGDVLILLYHRVGNGSAEIELPEVDLERQLAYLAARERVVPLEEALADGPAGGICLTFDDGTRDFTELVVPLLDRYRLPATLYLATALVDDEGGGGISWAQLRDAVATGLVTVGSHTHSHADLSRADERSAEWEMRRSKELIEEHLGVRCRHFAYPWAGPGRPADRMARRLFDSAALDAWRTNRRGRIDPHRLGRTPVLASDGFTFFRAKARGMLDAEALLYRVLGRGPWGRAT